MKKLFFVAFAALTLGLASCGESKTDEATAVIENLKTQLEAGDANAVQATLQAAQEKIAELVAQDPEAAKTYVAKIQDFVKENKEKITTVVGDDIVTQQLVSTLVDTPAETVISTLTAGQNVLDNAQAVADSTAQAIEDRIEEAVQGQIDQAEGAVNDKVDEAKQAAADEVNKATDKANEEINKAADKAMKSLGL